MFTVELYAKVRHAVDESTMLLSAVVPFPHPRRQKVARGPASSQAGSDPAPDL
jgi:hypothetical protein